jgi:hypothetical protein
MGRQHTQSEWARRLAPAAGDQGAGTSTEGGRRRQAGGQARLAWIRQYLSPFRSGRTGGRERPCLQSSAKYVPRAARGRRRTRPPGDTGYRLCTAEAAKHRRAQCRRCRGECRGRSRVVAVQCARSCPFPLSPPRAGVHRRSLSVRRRWAQLRPRGTVSLSRYQIPALHARHSCVVGSDPPLGTVFARVFPTRGAQHHEQVVWWVGTDVREIPTVRALASALRQRQTGKKEPRDATPEHDQ